MANFRPNIYPIMYWGLLYGLAAGLLLFAVFLLSQFITVVWFPVFLAGVIWGGYRNYRKQKQAEGMPTAPQRPMQEFREAAQDIVAATRDMLAEQEQADLSQTPLEPELPATPLVDEAPDQRVAPPPPRPPVAPQ